MEKSKTYRTMIKGGHALSSEYSRARIANIALEITGNYSTNRLIYNNKLLEDGKRIPERGSVVLTHECTAEEYGKFRGQVEASYPGLCIFNYRGNVK